MTKEKSEKNNIKKVQLHARISEEIYNTIDDLAEDYGSKSKVIEKAVDFFKKYKKNWDKEQQTWNRARKELNMVLVGRTTFQSYISGNYETAWKENIATKVIEWITQKHLSDLSLEKTLEAIRDMWIIANYFTHVEIKNLGKNSFVMTFYHTFNQKYGQFWSNYFKTWLENNKKCEITYSVEHEFFKLTIN
jgi:hypothetical protein